jgi:hypothetical protein
VPVIDLYRNVTIAAFEKRCRAAFRLPPTDRGLDRNNNNDTNKTLCRRRRFPRSITSRMEYGATPVFEWKSVPWNRYGFQSPEGSDAQDVSGTSNKTMSCARAITDIHEVNTL